MALPKGVHRVGRKLVSGKMKFHFYTSRGGTKFWEGSVREPSDPDFYDAYSEARERPRQNANLTEFNVELFLSSPAVPKGERSRRDQKKWLLRFAQHFNDAPMAMWEERKSRHALNLWRDQWKHSPKQYDMAGSHAARFLNWAEAHGIIGSHHFHKLPKLYSVDRSEIVWTDADRAAINTIAPEWIKRILCAACETGLRPGDLIKLTRNHVEMTPLGRRLRVRTAKRNKIAHIPVTPEMGLLIDETPADRMLILVNSQGNALTTHSASEGLRKWRDKAGLSRELRLYDCRGTAATRLLNADLGLADLSDFMGWSIRFTGTMIQHYARVSPGKSDEILIKLAKAKGAES